MKKEKKKCLQPSVCPIVGCFMVQAQHYHLVKMLNECKSFMISKEQVFFSPKGVYGVLFATDEGKVHQEYHMLKSYLNLRRVKRQSGDKHPIRIAICFKHKMSAVNILQYKKCQTDPAC